MIVNSGYVNSGYVVVSYREKNRSCQVYTWGSSYKSWILALRFLKKLRRTPSKETAAYFQDKDEAKFRIEGHLRSFPMTRFGYACSFPDARQIVMHVLTDFRASEAIDQILDTYLTLPESPAAILASDDTDSLWSVIIFP